jgi:leucyl aminopeptidase
MLLTPFLALLPFLAWAVPTNKPLGIQGESDVIPEISGFAVDLNELRLVQFAEDEPPV